MTLLAFALVSSANAAELDQTEPMLYARGRASLSMPSGVVGIAAPMSLAVGARFPNGHALGIRAMGMTDPPDVSWGNPGDFAAGLVFDWAWYGAISDNIDIYPTLAFGTLMAVDQRTQRNIVLPVHETGIGMQYKAQTGSGSVITVAPEIGVVPLLLAPYAALNVGVLFGA